MKADREAKAAEAAQQAEEQPVEEQLEAVVQPVPDQVVEEVAEVVAEVVEEPVEVVAEPVPEPEAPTERPDREFDSFVEDNVGKFTFMNLFLKTSIIWIQIPITGQKFTDYDTIYPDMKIEISLGYAQVAHPLDCYRMK